MRRYGDPTDHVADTNLCGAKETGDRVAYLRFDMRDFSFDAVGTAVFRATPDGFPPDMEVEVWAGCDPARPTAAIRWDLQPTAGYRRCVWNGNPDRLWDGATRGCDVTHDVRMAAGGFFCLKLTGSADAAHHGRLYGAARFYSRDAGDAERVRRAEIF